MSGGGHQARKSASPTKLSKNDALKPLALAGLLAFPYLYDIMGELGCMEFFGFWFIFLLSPPVDNVYDERFHRCAEISVILCTTTYTLV